MLMYHDTFVDVEKKTTKLGGRPALTHATIFLNMKAWTNKMRIVVQSVVLSGYDR